MSLRNESLCACGRIGLIKRDGRWLCDNCARGYIRPERQETRAPRENYRQRWFRENKQPYFDPPLGDFFPFRCVGRMAAAALPQRQREPGEDEMEES